MGTSSVNLPAGFELEENSAPNLPAGFELENGGMSKLQSFGAGAAQGASLGFADEGAGAISAIPKIAESVLSGKVNPQELLEDYRNSRDSFRKKFGEAKETNPKSYLGGELAGGAATLAVPGAPEASLANMAAMGGIQGLGNSTADLTQGDVGGAAKDAAIGAGTGAVMSKVAPAIMGGIAKIPEAAGWLGKKAITSFLGPSEEAINARLSNPGSIANAKTYAELAEQLPAALKKLQTKIKQNDSAAWETLSDSLDPTDGAISVDSVKQRLKQIADSLNIEAGQGSDLNFQGVVGSSHHKAFGVIQSFLNDMRQFLPDPAEVAKQIEEKNNPDVLKRMGGQLDSVFGLNPEQSLLDYPGTLSEKAQRKIIQAADDNINWDDPDLGVSNRLLKDFRESIDSRLKSTNEEYDGLMGPLADKVDLLNKIKRSFNIKNDVGEGLVPTDTTASNLQRVTGDKKAVSQGLLGNLKNETGHDFFQDAQNAGLADEFKGGRINGSKNVLTFSGLGAGAGSMIGGPPGAIVGGATGSALGSYVDRNGRDLAGTILDKTSSAKTWIADKIPDILKSNPQLLGKYAPMFQNAAQGGAQAISVRHFVLMNQDPQYRQMIHNMEDQNQ